MGTLRAYLAALWDTRRQRWFKLAYIAWAAVAAYDLLLAQFLPSNFASRFPRVADLLGGWLPWWAWLLILLLLVVFALLDQVVSLRDPGGSAGQRISITDLLREASQLGVNFGGAGQAILAAAHDLRQAGIDDALTLYGRPNRHRTDSLNRNEPLHAIPKDHWDRFQIDAMSLVRVENGDLDYRIAPDNFQTATYNPQQERWGDGGYIDLHADAAQGRRWLQAKLENLKAAGAAVTASG